jgi:hypothetical protein
MCHYLNQALVVVSICVFTTSLCLTLLNHTGPITARPICGMAEGVGFEPTVPARARRFSRPVP